MLKRGILLMACALVSWAQAEIGVCGLYQQAYQSEIKPKILAGVPFELMKRGGR